MRVEVEKALLRETERELNHYRQNGALLRAKQAGKGAVRQLRSEEIEGLSCRELARMRCWQRVVNRVLALARRDDPLMYRFMRQYFALVTPRSGRLSVTQRNLNVIEELGLSESLVYTMRRRAVANVMLAAVEAGLFKPYGLRQER